MSQRFFRCPHCRLPHEEGEPVCPLTGQKIEARRSASSIPPPDERPREVGRSEPPGRSEPAPGVKLPGDGLRPAERSREGEVLGGVYLVKEPLGRGATAVVYEGEHLPLGRRVALKVMTAERVGNQEARRRFLQEAQAVASLSHGNICQVYDLGTLPDGALFCAMEYLQGEPLSACIEREGALSLVDVVEFGVQMLAGLHEAHSKGIVHRDVKPENVFLARVPGVQRPVVKLLDFGLAKLLVPPAPEGDEPTQITRAGVVVGTPFYMAPEAVTGQSVLDRRADLWAVGVVLFLGLTGRLPFRGVNWAETAQAILHRPLPAIHELRGGVPPELAQAIERALEKNRERRQASAMDFARQLVQVRRILHTP
ncbi:MAG: serine/threonine protein kinase [Polyangiaceae bacterium]|nr:serine/threonine protein kinase [Polyangiaceae bacterium]